MGVHILLLSLAGLMLGRGEKTELTVAPNYSAVRVSLRPGRLEKPELTEIEAPLTPVSETKSSVSGAQGSSAPAESGPDSAGAAGSDSVQFTHKTAESLNPVLPYHHRVTEPRPIKPIVPVYPITARRSGLDGIVVLEINIDRQGRPLGFKTISRSHRILEDAAIKAVMAGMYLPGMRDDVPVQATLRLRFVFRLSS